MAPYWKRGRTIEQMLNDYFAQCDVTLGHFERAIGVYLKEGIGPAFEEAVQNAHHAESAADDIRREIELTLYGKELLPESRGDILGLLEAYDKLPNMAETILFSLLCQRVKLPETFGGRFKALIDLNLSAYYQVGQSVQALFHNPSHVLAVSKQVDPKESQSDKDERNLVCEIFALDVPMGEKLLLKELVLLIGHLSDLSKKVADRVNIIAIKRQL